MRFLTAALAIVLSAAAFCQSYEEGAMSIPSSRNPRIMDELKVRVWPSLQTTRIEIGALLVLEVSDSPNSPGFSVVDRRTGQIVTVQSDGASLKQLAALEGSIFPLIPSHSGFAADWNDFSTQLYTYSNQPVSRLTDNISKRNGLENVDYNFGNGLFAGRVGWEMAGDSHQMVSWHFTPSSGQTRSIRMGEGYLRTPYSRLEYGGNDSDAPSRALYSQRSSLSLVNGQLTVRSGFLQNANQAKQWLAQHSAYLITD